MIFLLQGGEIWYFSYVKCWHGNCLKIYMWPLLSVENPNFASNPRAWGWFLSQTCRYSTKLLDFEGKICDFSYTLTRRWTALKIYMWPLLDVQNRSLRGRPDVYNRKLISQMYECGGPRAAPSPDLYFATFEPWARLLGFKTDPNVSSDLKIGGRRFCSTSHLDFLCAWSICRDFGREITYFWH